MYKILLLLVSILTLTAAGTSQSRLSVSAGVGDFASTDLALDQDVSVIYNDCVVPTGHMFLKEMAIGYSYRLTSNLEIGSRLRASEGHRSYFDTRSLTTQDEYLHAYQLDALCSYHFYQSGRIMLSGGVGIALMYRQLNTANQTELSMINSREHQVVAQTIDRVNRPYYEFRGGITMQAAAKYLLNEHFSLDLILSASGFCDPVSLEESTSQTVSTGISYFF